MNYYSFHIGDFRSGTINMSRQSRWIYRDMLDIYYDTERPLPLDFDVLCDLLGVESDEDIKIVEKLLRFKFEKSDDGYRNNTCVRVISEYHAKADIAKSNGKLGGRPKKLKEPSGFLSGSNPVSKPNPTGTGSEANQEPLTTNHKKEKHISAESSGILEYLNSKVGSNFKPVESNTKLIEARINEGATIDELKRVIDTKTTEWKSDPKMSEYLRPSTLFNPTKYAQYAGQISIVSDASSSEKPFDMREWLKAHT